MDLDFKIDQGSDFRRLIRIKDENRQAIDISARSYIGAVKKDYRSKKLFDIEMTLSTTNTGEIHLYISAEKTRPLRISETTEYIYDIKEFFGGEETILLSGKIFINPRVN